MIGRYVLVVALLMLGPIAAARAQDQVKLFKIITQKDDVVVGVTTEELARFGTGPDLDRLARQLSESGQMTIWQYAVLQEHQRHSATGPAETDRGVQKRHVADRTLCVAVAGRGSRKMN